MNYSKYYLLEDYIFGDVRTNFLKRHYLTSDEFFCIVIWKSNRAKTAIKRRLQKRGDLDNTIKILSSQIFNTKGREEKLKILLNDWQFHLPMASAILTVLYPNDFTVYDVRVRSQLGIVDFSERKNQVEKYFNEYLPSVERVDFGKSLRDKDKYLWGKSFYDSLIKFLKY